MRGGIPIVVFIISLAISVFLFLICSYILGVATEAINPLANETLAGTSYLTSYNSFLPTLQTTFGIFCVMSMIGIIAAYVLDSHREEGEEFQYYGPNQYQ